jgi:hypothetical protein
MALLPSQRKKRWSVEQMNARHDLEMSSSMIAAAMIVSACSTAFYAGSLLDLASF